MSKIPENWIDDDHAGNLRVDNGAVLAFIYQARRDVTAFG
jgi:hypothetical protein